MILFVSFSYLFAFNLWLCHRRCHGHFVCFLITVRHIWITAFKQRTWSETNRKKESPKYICSKVNVRATRKTKFPAYIERHCVVHFHFQSNQMSQRTNEKEAIHTKGACCGSSSKSFVKTHSFCVCCSRTLFFILHFNWVSLDASF